MKMRKFTAGLLVLGIVVISGCAGKEDTYNSNKYPKEYGVVANVTDGDTLVLETGNKIRLLNINTPERGAFYYTEAKEKLKK